MLTLKLKTYTNEITVVEVRPTILSFWYPFRNGKYKRETYPGSASTLVPYVNAFRETQ